MPSSTSNLRRIARVLRTAEKFVTIDLHPAVYVSFVAVNLCIFFAYRELAAPVVEHEHRPSLASPMDNHNSIKIADCKTTEKEWPYNLPEIVKPTVAPKAEKQEPKKEVAVVKSAGAALAMVPEKRPPKPRKKTKRYGNGLVPPPPPGVMVVPPPPDAPSLLTVAGKHSFLVPPPPPMVFDGASDYPQNTQSATRSHSHKTRKDYGKRYGDDRSKTVTHGNYKRVIVSR